MCLILAPSTAADPPSFLQRKQGSSTRKEVAKKKSRLRREERIGQRRTPADGQSLPSSFPEGTPGYYKEDGGGNYIFVPSGRRSYTGRSCDGTLEEAAFEKINQEKIAIDQPWCVCCGCYLSGLGCRCGKGEKKDSSDDSEGGGAKSGGVMSTALGSCSGGGGSGAAVTAAVAAAVGLVLVLGLVVFVVTNESEGGDSQPDCFRELMGSDENSGANCFGEFEKLFECDDE